MTVKELKRRAPAKARQHNSEESESISSNAGAYIWSKTTPFLNPAEILVLTLNKKNVSSIFIDYLSRKLCVYGQVSYISPLFPFYFCKLLYFTPLIQF